MDKEKLTELGRLKGRIQARDEQITKLKKRLDEGWESIADFARRNQEFMQGLNSSNMIWRNEYLRSTHVTSTLLDMRRIQEQIFLEIERLYAVNQIDYCAIVELLGGNIGSNSDIE